MAAIAAILFPNVTFLRMRQTRTKLYARLRDAAAHLADCLEAVAADPSMVPPFTDSIKKFDAIVLEHVDAITALQKQPLSFLCRLSVQQDKGMQRLIPAIAFWQLLEQGAGVLFRRAEEGVVSLAEVRHLLPRMAQAVRFTAQQVEGAQCIASLLQRRKVTDFLVSSCLARFVVSEGWCMTAVGRGLVLRVLWCCCFYGGRKMGDL